MESASLDLSFKLQEPQVAVLEEAGYLLTIAQAEWDIHCAEKFLIDCCLKELFTWPQQYHIQAVKAGKCVDKAHRGVGRARRSVGITRQAIIDVESFGSGFSNCPPQSGIHKKKLKSMSYPVANTKFVFNLNLLTGLPPGVVDTDSDMNDDAHAINVSSAPAPGGVVLDWCG